MQDSWDTCTVCNLNMKYTLSGQEDVRSLMLHASCATVLDVKRAIEKQYSIPSCVQCLTFHNVPLSDTDAFNATHVSRDEILSVSFPSEANVSGVREAVDWLNSVCVALQKHCGSNYQILNAEISGLLQQASVSGTIHNLSVDLFYPWEPGLRYMNKLYFNDCGGLKAMCSVYSYLLQLDWAVMHQDLRFLEVVCTQSITNFLQSFELRRRFIQLGGLDMCISTLLRCKLDMSPYLDSMSRSAIEVALYAVCNLSELPECHLVIAKNHDIITQIISALSSPRYACKLAVVAVSVFLCIAQSGNTHPYLLTNEVVVGLLRSCEVRTLRAKSEKDIHELNAFRCYVAASLAIMIIPSSHELSDETVQRNVCTLMETVLSSLTPSMLEKYEDQEGLMWCSLRPYIRLFYQPTLYTHLLDPVRRSLHILSVKIILRMLHGTFLRKVHCNLVYKEGMQDYVIALPWVVPANVSQAASDLVSDFASQHPLQPPTLVNIVKGRLASWHLGLDSVVDTSVRDIVTSLY